MIISQVSYRTNGPLVFYCDDLFVDEINAIIYQLCVSYMSVD